MISFRFFRFSLFIGCLEFIFVCLSFPAAETWDCEIYPNESQTLVDPQTRVKVVFVTTQEKEDTNLYFHDRSWTADESLLIFVSNRTGKTEPFGYIEKTGELVRLNSPAGVGTSGFTAGKKKNCLFLWKSDGVYEWNIEIKVDGDAKKPTHGMVSERKICNFPPDVSPSGALNENADSTRLSLILKHKDQPQYDIVFIDQKTGELLPITSVNWPASHLQCSWSNPDLVMFARTYPEGDRVPVMSETDYAAQEPHYRIWLAEYTKRQPWPLHKQVPGELVTHECWWIQDQLTFCGGYLPDESPVKVTDYHTGIIRIIGQGSWWPNGTSAELWKRNWWHAAGSPTGEWVAADNFHGDIVLFNARTTQMRPLVFGHRTYGGGAHPHVGWSPSGKRVVFTSNRRGNPDVCIAYIPD